MPSAFCWPGLTGLTKSGKMMPVNCILLFCCHRVGQGMSVEIADFLKTARASITAGHRKKVGARQFTQWSLSSPRLMCRRCSAPGDQLESCRMPWNTTGEGVTRICRTFAGRSCFRPALCVTERSGIIPVHCVEKNLAGG